MAMVTIQAAGTNARLSRNSNTSQATTPDWYEEFLKLFKADNNLDSLMAGQFTALMTALHNAFKSEFKPPRTLAGSNTAPDSIAAQTFRYVTRGTEGVETGKLLTPNKATIKTTPARLELVPAVVDGKKQKPNDDDLRAFVLAAYMNGNFTGPGNHIKIKGGTFLQRRKIERIINELNENMHPECRMTVSSFLKRSPVSKLASPAVPPTETPSSTPENPPVPGNPQTPGNSPLPEEQVARMKAMFGKKPPAKATDARQETTSEPRTKAPSNVQSKLGGETISEEVREQLVDLIRQHTQKSSGLSFTDSNLAAYWDALDKEGRNMWLQRAQDAVGQKEYGFAREESGALLTQEQIAQAQDNLKTFLAEQKETAISSDKISNEDEILSVLEELAAKHAPLNALTPEQSEEIKTALTEELDEFVQQQNINAMAKKDFGGASSFSMSGTATGELLSQNKVTFNGDGSTFPISQTWSEVATPLPKTDRGVPLRRESSCPPITPGLNL